MPRIVVLLLLLLSACASVPPAPEGTPSRMIDRPLVQPGDNSPTRPPHDFNPLRLHVRLSFPPHITTIRAAANYLLEPTPYRLVTAHPAPKESAEIVDTPFNPRSLPSGKILPIEDALLLIVPKNYLVVDHTHGKISFTFPENALPAPNPSQQPTFSPKSPAVNGPFLPAALQHPEPPLATDRSFSVVFKNESFRLRPTAAAVLDRVAAAAGKESQILIVGRSHGPSKIGNSHLATRRANRVATLLMKRGIAKDRIQFFANWSTKKASTSDRSKSAQIYLVSAKNDELTAPVANHSPTAISSTSTD